MDAKKGPRKLVEALNAALVDGDNEKSKSLLTELWPHLSGSNETAMADHKVDRADRLVYEPPFVTFAVERHGAMVAGASSRAELQSWVVDLEKLTAMCSTVGHKQMHPMQKPLDVGPMANEIAHAVLKGENRPELKWRARDDVQLEMGKVIPNELGTAKATMEGRRKRLRLKLAEILASKGWVSVGPNRYQRRS